MNNYVIEMIGGFILWLINGFKGTLKHYENHKWSFWVGLGFILLVIIIFSLF